MLALTIAGLCLSLAGLAGILWCILAARRLGQQEGDDAELRPMLTRLIMVHTAALGAAFLGLGLLVVGLVLS